MHHVDFIDYPVSDDTIFFVAPGQVHAFDGANDYEGVIIHFNAYDSLPYCKITSEEADRLMLLVNEMNREYSLTGAFAHRDYMQNLLRLYLIRIRRSGERKEMQKLYVSCIANRTFVRFRQLLEQNFHRVHTVQDYADLLNISARTLTKYVSQSAHRSPLKIINERIVLEAKRQILHSTLSIKEVAFQLGFEDPSYFVKFFKRQTGYLPSDFREADQVTHCISRSGRDD